MTQGERLRCPASASCVARRVKREARRAKRGPQTHEAGILEGIVVKHRGDWDSRPPAWVTIKSKWCAALSKRSAPTATELDLRRREHDL